MKMVRLFKVILIVLPTTCKTQVIKFKLILEEVQIYVNTILTVKIVMKINKTPNFQKFQALYDQEPIKKN